jgi:hypothetical protein
MSRQRYWLLLMMLTISPVSQQGFVHAQQPHSWAEPAFRQRQARNWLAAFTKIDREVPTLSPSEQAWLKSEIDDELARNGNRYTKRAIAAMNSREYDIRVVRAALPDLTVALSQLTRAAITQQAEVVRWAQVAARTLDPLFWQAIDNLVRRKVVSPEINGVSEGYLENHAGWSSALLSQFVIPFLSRRGG